MVVISTWKWPVKKVLIVGDGGEPEALKDAFSRAGSEAVVFVSPKSISVPALVRHAHYLHLAVKTLALRRRFDEILIWQQYIAVYYGLLDLVFPLFRRPFSIYYIIFSPSERALGYLKRLAFVTLLRRPSLKKAFFMHSGDPLISHIDQDRAVVYSENYRYSACLEAGFKDRSCPTSPFYFSGGASNRDYGLLVEVAEALSDKLFIIACAASNVSEIKKAPPNLHIEVDMQSDPFERLIIEATAVIIPLKRSDVIAGQLVILQALQAGKAIFISANDGISEWLGPSVDDFLFRFSDGEDLLRLITTTSQVSIEQAGRLGRRFYELNVSSEQFYDGLVARLY